MVGVWLLSVDDVLAIHAKVIADDPVDMKHPNLMPGGRARIEHALARCREVAESSEEGLIRFAACIALGLNQAHPFDAGNKRTALVTAMTVLRANGWTFAPPPEEARRFMVGVRERVVSNEEATAWIRRWSTKEKL